ncbi:MAG: LysR family transcriptional regulator [Limnothrix sp. RL_2_0]|nr:LysR family transcriptional regulator [Limnothrix sp. RL_2_0]
MLPATLHQLKVFETAARQGSFTKAAAELSITQPTVSGQIKQLTQTIGMPLFEHIGRKLYLTEAGEELLTTCKEIFGHLDNLEMKLSALKGAKQGQLHLGVITTTKYFVPRILGEFCQSYPDIEVSLQVVNHDQLHDRMASNQDDLYILSNLPGDLEVHSEAFLDNPLVVVARSDHPLAGKTNVPLSALRGEDFISREMGSGTRRAVESLFKSNDIEVQIRLELGSNEAIKQAIAGGLGISVLSRHTLITEPTDGELAVLDINHFPIQREWYVAYLAGKKLSVIAEAFREFMLKSSQVALQHSGRRSLALL